MAKSRMPDFVEVTKDHVIATKGIMSIKQLNNFVEVRYITGYCETVKGISMMELLDKLGRNPLVQGRTDSP